MTDKNSQKDQEVTVGKTNGSDDQKIDDIKKVADEYLDGWKRAKADYLNYKKEVEKRQQEIVEFANARMIADLLPIYENYKMAVKHIPADRAKDDWAVGLVYIQSQFQSFLNNLGIKEVKTVGEKFNPEFHESVASVASENDHPPDTIIEEVQTGYTLHGKVVVPAKVKVTK